MKEHGRNGWRIVRVAFFLASRYIARTSMWQTGLVVFVMSLTFLNLVVVNGILVGLIDGAMYGFQQNYAGDLLISKLPEKESIERASTIRGIVEQNDDIVAYSARIVEPATIEANYLASVSHPNIVPDRVAASVAGINIAQEESVTGVAKKLIEGSFLTETDDDSVVLGANLIDRYFPAVIGLQTLSEVYPGDKIRITIGKATREFFIKGIVKTKADATDLRVFMLENQLKKMRGGLGTANTDEFALRIRPGKSISEVQNDLFAYGIGSLALVRTTEEAIGEFLGEIKDTFSLLGNIIGGISVIVASITIFIIIFITAITRQKYIGILKGIGLSGITIELSYVILSIFYSGLGILIGVSLLYGVMLPYFKAHPINFPFSDGILSVTTVGVIVRSLILIVTTIIAGYLPARLIVQKNTLDAILGR
ncbi:MAG: ABC transporter permease [Patescibacteria group bacterium]